MKRFSAVLMLVILSGTVALSSQVPKLRPDNVPSPGPVRPRANPRQPDNIRTPAIEDVVISFYISQFQQVAQVNDEVFVKVLPFLRQFVQERFEVSTRRTRALNALRTLVQRDDSDDDLRRAIGQLDRADADIQAIQQKFLTNVDPLLSTQQQAKVRMFIPMADNRVRQMLDRIQNGGANRQSQPTPEQPRED